MKTNIEEEEIFDKVVRLWEHLELSSNQVSFTIIEYAKRFNELNDIVVELEEEHEENGYLEVDGFSNAMRFVKDIEYLKMLEYLYTKGDR